MGVSEKEHDLRRHSHTIPNTTTTVYRPTSLQFSIHELQSTVEDTEHRYRPSSPSVGSLTEDGVTDEYTFEYKNGRHGKTRNGHWKPNVREWLVLICVSAVVMMDAYNATVIVPMVPHLSHAFGRPLENILWLVTGYLLANAVAQTIFPMLAKIFSHGPILVAALVFATAGTGVCGGSEDFPELLAGRIVQGIGGGGAMAISLLVEMDNISNPQWADFSSWLFVVRVMGVMLGPVVGGTFIDYVHFNYAFYVTLIFCGLGLLVAPFAVDLNVEKSASFAGLRRLDWTGRFLNVAGACFFLVGLSWGGTEYTWEDWHTTMPMGVGAILLVMFVLWETAWAARPFKLRALNSRSMLSAYTSSFLHGFMLFCQLQYLVLYLTSTKYFTRFMAGLISLALTGQALATIVIIGRIRKMRKIEPVWIIRVGWTLTVVVTGCCIVLNKDTPLPGVILLLISAGLAHGLLIPGYSAYFTRATLQKQQNEEQEMNSTAGTAPIMLYSTLRAWGMCVAVPIAGTIMLSQLILQMKRKGLDTSNEELIRMNEVLLSEAAKDELEIIDRTGFRMVWQVVTMVAGLGGILSIFVKTR